MAFEHRLEVRDLRTASKVSCLSQPFELGTDCILRSLWLHTPSWRPHTRPVCEGLP
jgi:hypothetical protein